MIEFTITDPKTGDTFAVQGPQGMTLEQAQAIFKQQSDAGSLVGIRDGDIISAVTQAAGGSVSAQAALVQSLGSTSGKLPPGTNLNTISSSVGPGGLSAAQQTQRALLGPIAGIASLTTGSSSAVNTALTFPPLPNLGMIPGTSNITTEPLTGQFAQIGSVANASVSTLEKIITNVPLNGITTADFAKQSSATESIGNLSRNNVTGLLAQANKLVGQSAYQVSNSLGVGKYGFDSNQLERAEYIKPGTTVAFVNLTGSNLIDVLGSPTVWTGKNKIMNLNDLLINANIQDKIQQNLMSTGLNTVAQLGVPVDKLLPVALAGLAINAAKSVEAAFAWVTGSFNLPQIPTVPGGDVKSAFDSAATNGAFAIKMTTDKIEAALKQETDVIPAVNTVNADTVNAASLRIIGNNKVSPVSNGGDTLGSIRLIAIFDWETDIVALLESLDTKILEYQKVATVTQDQWNKLNSEFQIVRTEYTSKNVNYQQEAADIINNESNSTEKEFLLTIYQRIKDLQTKIEDYLKRFRLDVTTFTSKIST